MIVYKVLDCDGKSIYQHFQWPLPKGNRPSKWLKTKQQPVLCSKGFHGYLTLERAEQDCKRSPDRNKNLVWREALYQIYEMEIRGSIVTDTEKAAASEARLLRLIPDEPQLVSTGYRNCTTCDKPHNSYRGRNGLAPQWYDLVDGHSYNPEPWETYAARTASELELMQTAIAERKRVISEHPMPLGTSYNPVVPSFHDEPFRPWDRHPDKCGICGLDESLHDGYEERAALADEFKHADRWELLLVIQHMRRRGY
jgi:hypothetical protein